MMAIVFTRPSSNYVKLGRECYILASDYTEKNKANNLHQSMKLFDKLDYGQLLAMVQDMQMFWEVETGNQ